MLRLILSISLFISISAEATEVYRSVDENGRTIYSSEPPEGKKHETVDIEVKNKLGAKIPPSSNSSNSLFIPSEPVTTVVPNRKVYTRNTSSSRKNEKLDMKTLQEKCESYRNAATRSDKNQKQREKRDYWCSRLHRGK